MKLRHLLLLLPFLLASCKAYKQDILFKLDENFGPEDLRQPLSQAMENYRLQVNDIFGMELFTNKGERIVDPNFEMLSQGGGVGGQNMMNRRMYDYIIQVDGTVKLPLVGLVKVVGLTVLEAEQVLQQAYDAYYKESFVRLTVNNQRVVVLGANGGAVIPLTNDNTSLVEILALYGGLNMGAKAQNIKLIRGDLKNPEVYQIDLSTVHGMRTSIMEVEPGDIIYVEPWRRAWRQSIQDLSPVLGITSSMLALFVVIQNFVQ